MGRIRFPITTPRLTIRPMRLDDAEALLAVYGDVETMQHLNSELPTTVEEAREWVQTKIDLFADDDQLSLWTVIQNESGQIVGDVGLQHEDYGSGPVVGLGGRGNRQFWRKGLGFEAASAAIAAGFEQLNLGAIGAETRPENLPAQALLTKLGMRPAGTNTQGWPVYMITRDEWLQPYEPSRRITYSISASSAADGSKCAMRSRVRRPGSLPPSFRCRSR
jgi:[ribosomal protein S5]-alanine N-acetyltransferase